MCPASHASPEPRVQPWAPRRSRWARPGDRLETGDLAGVWRAARFMAAGTRCLGQLSAHRSSREKSVNRPRMEPLQSGAGSSRPLSDARARAARACGRGERLLERRAGALGHAEAEAPRPGPDPAPVRSAQRTRPRCCRSRVARGCGSGSPGSPGAAGQCRLGGWAGVAGPGWPGVAGLAHPDADQALPYGLGPFSVGSNRRWAGPTVRPKARRMRAADSSGSPVTCSQVSRTTL